MAPTLFGRKIENCFTSGPPVFDVVSGNFAVMKNLRFRVANCFRSSFRAKSETISPRG
jgi:hypothetical protein